MYSRYHMRHLDLFSGIGGFALAAREVWGEAYECIGFCEQDWFCQQVLTKNFPGVPIHDDIRTLINDRTYAHAVDLATGGFPCQPFSVAGRRRGTADDRYLWPEMLRVICEFQPSWVIAENVGGLVTWNGGLVFETVCADLEATGYEVQPFVIPAVSVNAPHRRDRLWIVAHAYGKRLERTLYRPGQAVGSGGKTAQSGSGHGNWERNWTEVASRLCRVDDGLSRRLVRLPDGTDISEARWCKEAIKTYGNAIVPQVAVEIMYAIRQVAYLSL